MDKPSIEQMSAATNPSVTEQSPAVTKVSVSPKLLPITRSHSSNVSEVVTTPNSTCGSGVNFARTNSSKKVSPFVKPKLSTGASLQEEENGTHTRETWWVLTEFLNYPSLTATPKSRAKKSNGPRSHECRSYCNVGRKGKTEERGAGSKRVTEKECEEKKQQREQEKIQEAEERLKSEAERKQKAEERELEKIRNKGKRKAELQQKQAAEREKHTRYGKQQISAAHDGLQSAEISSNECVACLGAIEGNIVDSVLEKEWIQCTNLEACMWEKDALQLPLY